MSVRLKVGVMGDSRDGLPKKVRDVSYRLGRAIAEHHCIAVTGACPGLPFEAARGVKEAGGLVIGISPGLSLWEHVNVYGSPTEHHDILIFTGSGLMGREVVNIRTSDIVVIMGGRSGTLGEFSIAYDEGKLIGILMGTGGITGQIKNIVRAVRKNTGTKVIYDSDPERLMCKLAEYYQKEHHKHPSVFNLRDNGLPAEGESQIAAMRKQLLSNGIKKQTKAGKKPSGRKA